MCLNRALVLPLGSELGPCPCAPEGHRNEHRLEKQPDRSGYVGVQTEGRCVGDVLRDIARKDEDIEGGQYPSDSGSVPLSEHEREGYSDFKNTRHINNEFWIWQEWRHLRPK